MQPKYEIIIRPPNIPATRVLECDGPSGDPIINYAPRTNLGVLSYDEWKAIPDYERETRYDHPTHIDHATAMRIGRLLSHCYQTRNISIVHLLVIMTRFELLYPGAIDDCRKSKISA
jgi:hypothetical protein